MSARNPKLTPSAWTLPFSRQQCLPVSWALLFIHNHLLTCECQHPLSLWACHMPSQSSLLCIWSYKEKEDKRPGCCHTFSLEGCQILKSFKEDWYFSSFPTGWIPSCLSADTVPEAFLRCVKYSWVSYCIVSSSPLYNKSPTPLKLSQVTYEIFKIIILSLYHITLTQLTFLGIWKAKLWGNSSVGEVLCLTSIRTRILSL